MHFQMTSIQHFPDIQSYLQTSNLKLDQKLPDFMIYRFGDVNADAEIEHFAYRHHFFEITLDITEGCTFQVDDFRFPLESNRLSLISPRRLQSVQLQRVHGTSSEGFTLCKGFTLFFDQDFIQRHFAYYDLLQDYPFFKHTQSPVTYPDQRLMREVTDIFEKIYYEYTVYGSQSREVIQSYLNILLLKGKMGYRSDSRSIALNREVELAHKFESFCQENFLTHFTVKEVAQELNVSPKHLSETVKKITGKRALGILNGFRLMNAKALLSQTSLTSRQIAYELNFENPDYFFTFFKKSTGLTPLQFRQI